MAIGCLKLTANPLRGEQLAKYRAQRRGAEEKGNRQVRIRGKGDEKGEMNTGGRGGHVEIKSWREQESV